jgi:hypothetical protein
MGRMKASCRAHAQGLEAPGQLERAWKIVPWPLLSKIMEKTDRAPMTQLCSESQVAAGLTAKQHMFVFARRMQVESTTSIMSERTIFV